MNTQERQVEILKSLLNSDKPLSASFFAKKFNVSRQIIVGDVALLRAKGECIIATARGYIIENKKEDKKFLGIIVTKHDNSMLYDELYTIVSYGGKILDVIIDHETYGEIKCQLNISTIDDVKIFTNTLVNSSAKPLSMLSNGIH
ncbi:MAG: transcription repressor NadR, partial [Eubacteriales bacterium]|nr:transcription repressor NadR [Eubacteriales bacterium]